MGQTVASGGRSGRLLAATSLGYGSAFLGIAILAPLLPAIIEDLRLTSFEAGIAMSLAWGLFALAQFPAGRLSDRLSRKTVLVTGLTVCLVGALLVLGTTSLPLLLLSAAAIGLGSGCYPPAGLALVSEAFGARRGQAFGVILGSGDAAGMLAGGLAAGVLAIASWRTAYLPVAGLLVLSLVSIHRASDEPYVRGLRIDLAVGSTVGRLLGDRRRRTEVLGFALWMVAFQATTSFLPTFLRVAKGTSVGLASGGFALLWLVGILVKPVAGRYGDRVGHLPVSGGTTAVAAVGLAGLVVAPTLPLVAVALVVFAAGLLGTTPNVFAHITTVTPDADLGGDIGALRSVLFGAGSLGPAGVGLVAESRGFDTAFAAVAACLVAATAIILVLAHTAPDPGPDADRRG